MDRQWEKSKCRSSSEPRAGEGAVKYNELVTWETKGRHKLSGEAVMSSEGSFPRNVIC